MKIEFNLSEMKDYLESKIALTLVVNKKGDVVSELDTGYALMKFCNKVMDYAKAATWNKTIQSVERYRVQKVASGEDIIYINIKNTSVSEVFFDTFKKLGMPSAYMQIGIDFINKTLYLNKGVISYISRLGNKAFTIQIGMYLISLAYLFSKNSTEDLMNTFISNASSSVTALKDELNTAELLYQFMDNEEYQIKELDLNDIDMITYYEPCTNKQDFDKASYALVKNNTNEQFLILVRESGIKSFSVVSSHTALTSVPLNMFHLGGSESHFLASLTTSKMIMNNQSASVMTGDELVLSDEFEPTFNEPFNAFVLSIMESAVPYKKKNDLKTLLGVKSITGTVSAFDSESIREYYKDDLYAQELYKNEKDYYKTFDLEDMERTVIGFAKGDIYTMLFYGESGTGKSTAAKVIPYKCGFPVVNINFSVNIEESDLFGTMIPNPSKKSAEDPEFIWKDGVITMAARNGYVVVLEELTLARAGVLGKFNSLLDESRQIELPTGEILHAHKNFRIIATCNIGYEGTNILNAALVNRFQIVKEFVELDKLAFIEVVQARTEYTNKGNIESIYNVYQAIKKYSDENNLGLVISIRQLLNIFTAGKYFKSAYDAVINMLVNVAFLQDKDYKDSFVKSILPAYNLKFKI